MTDTRVCDHCRTEFTRNGRAKTEWARRRFCGRACALAGIARPGKIKQTHCRPKGHELTPDNLYVYGRRRQCRACNLGRTDSPRTPKPAPVPAPAPIKPATPPWRPAAWGPVEVTS